MLDLLLVEEAPLLCLPKTPRKSIDGDNEGDGAITFGRNEVDSVNIIKSNRLTVMVMVTVVVPIILLKGDF